jgi:hypothetical protein
MEEITVKDLDTLKNIVALAAERGAFRANELSEIGAVYDKLSIFLNAVLTQAQAEAASAAQTGD